MVNAHAPLMSVTVAYLRPVSVFCAVTATPGSGTAPLFPAPEPVLFTVPCRRPPLTAGCAPTDCDGAAAGTLAGSCAAAPSPAAHTTIANHRNPACILLSPRGFLSMLALSRSCLEDVRACAKVYRAQ